MIPESFHKRLWRRVKVRLTDVSGRLADAARLLTSVNLDPNSSHSTIHKDHIL